MAYFEIIQKHRKSLLSTIDKDDVIVEVLYSQNVLTERQYQIVKAETVPLQAAEKLLSFLQYSGIDGFVKFCNALDQEYSWLASGLKKDASKIGIDFDIQNNSECSAPKKLPLQLLELVPTEKELMTFSKPLIRNDWQAVLYELGLNTANIQQCKQSNTLESLQCMSGLVLWLRKNGHAATFHYLYAACENADVDMQCLTNLICIAEKHS